MLYNNEIGLKKMAIIYILIKKNDELFYKKILIFLIIFIFQNNLINNSKKFALIEIHESDIRFGAH